MADAQTDTGDDAGPATRREMVPDSYQLTVEGSATKPLVAIVSGHPAFQKGSSCPYIHDEQFGHRLSRAAVQESVSMTLRET